MSNGCILYIGKFMLPDKNAAAHRVLANAKIFRDLDYEVIFIDVDEELFYHSLQHREPVEGFERWSIGTCKSPFEVLHSLYSIRYLKKITSLYSDIKYIIAYNYPSVALDRVNRYCKQKKYKCIADVTEWYHSENENIFINFIKNADSSFRMKTVHKKLDGLIVISSHLQNYYNSQNVINLPPLIDSESDKWTRKSEVKTTNDCTRFVYVGSPSAQKEQLDLIVNSINELSKQYSVRLDIVGITKDQFVRMYNVSPDGSSVWFHGRLSHAESLNYVKNANYSFIIRPNSLLTRAGFPTKLVESISCGTPVIANATSDLPSYICNGKNGFIVDTDIFNHELEIILNKPPAYVPDKNIFDYRNYFVSMKSFLLLMNSIE